MDPETFKLKWKILKKLDRSYFKACDYISRLFQESINDAIAAIRLLQKHWHYSYAELSELSNQGSFTSSYRRFSDRISESLEILKEIYELLTVRNLERIYEISLTIPVELYGVSGFQCVIDQFSYLFADNV